MSVFLEPRCRLFSEHLAFNATEQFEKHAIVTFLESIGAAFGPCQNAYTSADETVYELLVPIDKEDTLRRALSVLSEWACRTRCSPADLAKERGAVLEEWRQGRDARGRAFEAAWRTIYGGCRYADRLPIGTEAVIRGCSAESVRRFYTKWYRPQHMAVVAVGDFAACGGRPAVVAALREVFSAVAPPADAPWPAPVPPTAQFVAHAQPRYLAYSERQLTDSTVAVSWTHPASPLACAADFARTLAEDLFCSCLNQRLFRIARRREPPFYSASVSVDSPLRAVTMRAPVSQGRTPCRRGHLQPSPNTVQP